MNYRNLAKSRILGVLVAVLCLVAAECLAAEDADSRSPVRTVARQILNVTGVKGGLIVHLGCGDGKLTAALHAGEAYSVQGLDVDSSEVQTAREYLQSQGLYGCVSVDGYTGKTLPYVDNLANLVVAEDLADLTMDEVLRVLCPNGVAYVKQDSQWGKTVKPRPEAIDDWTHFLHDATGNAVAHDRVVAAPRRLQWIAGPLWSRSHEYDSSLCAMVSSRGRLFSIFDEGPTGIIDPRIPDQWTLTARDASNGIVLWKREIPDCDRRRGSGRRWSSLTGGGCPASGPRSPWRLRDAWWPVRIGST